MPTLLIVEDDLELQELYSAMLKPIDCEIVMATDGEQALERLKAVEPDLVILDIILDRMMGDEFYRRLRQEPRHQNTPVIVISVLAQDHSEQILAMDSRAVFLRKPFRKQELLDAVVGGLGVEV